MECLRIRTLFWNRIVFSLKMKEQRNLLLINEFHQLSRIIFFYVFYLSFFFYIAFPLLISNAAIVASFSFSFTPASTNFLFFHVLKRTFCFFPFLYSLPSSSPLLLLSSQPSFFSAFIHLFFCKYVSILFLLFSFLLL